MRARVANHARQAKYSGSELTESMRDAATTALNKRLVEQYDIDPLDPDYATKLSHARSAYYTSLALSRSIKASRQVK